MKSYKTPTTDQVEKAVSAIARAEKYRYFFDGLENPHWLDPLRKKGFFKNPPATIRDPAENTIRYPVWPESRFLSRMARHDPHTVYDILLDIPETENPMVRSDILEAALQMPPDLAADLVPKVKTWLVGDTDVYIVRNLAALIRHLASGGHKASLDLLKRLLRVAPPEETSESGARRSNPRISVDTWHYKQILESTLPAVVTAAQLPALEAMCDLLNSAISYYQAERHYESEDNDFSTIWCRSVEYAGQDAGLDVKDLLVAAVRDSAKQLVRERRTSLGEILSTLEATRWPVFRRLALQVLREFPDEGLDAAKVQLTDHAQFDNRRLEPEYSLLAEAYFGKLPEPDQDTILDWIETGPDLEQYRTLQKAWDGTELTDEQLCQYADQWRRDRLRPIRDSLPRKWRERYDALSQSLGEPSFPPYQHQSSFGWVGDVSPKNARELEGMGTTELVAFLAQWKPPANDPRETSVEGLANELERAVKASPQRFAMDAASFGGLRHIYLHRILSGLRDLIKQKWDARWWAPVLKLCHLVLTNTRIHTERDDQNQERDTSPRWCRQVVCQILAAGLEKGPAPIQFAHRTTAWDILEPLTEDQNPTPEDRPVTNGEGVIDYVTSSINTVRGEAMHAVVRYALWIRQSLEQLPEAEERLGRGFEEMTEVQRVLERHLNAKFEQSPVIRSVYGQWFPWLCLLDEEWAENHVEAIFPSEESADLLWQVAWSAYINWCPPFAGVFRILHAQYERALGLLGRPSQSWPEGSSDEHFAEHLMVYYWQGRLPLDEDDGLLKRFIRNASPLVRAHAIEFVGRSLEGTDDPVPPQIVERLCALWDWRLKELGQADKPSCRTELAPFGWWFASGRLDDERMLAYLRKTLVVSGWAEPDHQVVQQLARLAQSHPSICVDCLQMMVEEDQKGLEVYSWREHARAVLATVIRSSDNAAKQAARDLVNRLGARGFIEFGELLQQ